MRRDPVPIAETAKAVYNSVICRAQGTTLNRIAQGPRAAQFPNLVKLFSGKSAQKIETLTKYMEAGENAGLAEAGFTIKKGHSDISTKNRQWLTMKEMKDKGCSEQLCCSHRLCAGPFSCPVSS